MILPNDQIGQLFGNAISNLPPPSGGGGVDVGAVDPGQDTGNKPPADGDGAPIVVATAAMVAATVVTSSTMAVMMAASVWTMAGRAMGLMTFSKSHRL